MNDLKKYRIRIFSAIACASIATGVLFFLPTGEDETPISEDKSISHSVGGAFARSSVKVVAEKPQDNPLLIVRETSGGELLIVLNAAEEFEGPITFEVFSQGRLSFSKSTGMQVDEVADGHWLVSAELSSELGGQTLLVYGANSWLALDFGALPVEMQARAKFGSGLQSVDGVVRALLNSPKLIAKEL